MQTDDRQVSTVEVGQPLTLRPGELVEVRSQEEILATLDEDGRLEGLPFMPEMLQFAGRRLRVYKRAIKACDTIGNTGMYRMERAVHLEGVRCDGQAHGGCQASCLIYWKDAWLKPAQPDASGNGQGQHAPAAKPETTGSPLPLVSRCTVATLHGAARSETGSAEAVYSCQATDLPKAATAHIRGFDLGQYVRDVTSGNARPLPTLRGLLVLIFNKFQWANRRFLPGRPLVHGGASYPFIDGRVRGRTPKEVLDLQPGELVEVKSKEEIFATLDQGGANRGLRFDGEMLRYCGQRARVLRRVDHIIDEKTGKMLRLPGDCIILEGVICAADYHQFCPRSIYPYWREIWLRRVQ
jgi:hypothetical protein